MLGLSTDLRSSYALARKGADAAAPPQVHHMVHRLRDPSLMKRHTRVEALSHKQHLTFPNTEGGLDISAHRRLSFTHTQHASIQRHPCDKPAAQRAGVCVGRCATGECDTVCVCNDRFSTTARGVCSSDTT
jgi:hypothetical protein